MFFQDNDPHHLHPNMNYIYVFLILAVLLLVVVLFVGAKLMNFLDDRYERKTSDDLKCGSRTDSQSGDEI